MLRFIFVSVPLMSQVFHLNRAKLHRTHSFANNKPKSLLRKALLCHRGFGLLTFLKSWVKFSSDFRCRLHAGGASQWCRNARNIQQWGGKKRKRNRVSVPDFRHKEAKMELTRQSQEQQSTRQPESLSFPLSLNTRPHKQAAQTPGRADSRNIGTSSLCGCLVCVRLDATERGTWREKMEKEQSSTKQAWTPNTHTAKTSLRLSSLSVTSAVTLVALQFLWLCTHTPTVYSCVLRGCATLLCKAVKQQLLHDMFGPRGTEISISSQASRASLRPPSYPRISGEYIS